MKIVLDVNVWVSALLWGGLPTKIFYLARQNRLIILVSDSILKELENTLRREKFKQQLNKRKLTVEYLITITQRLCKKSPDSSINFNVPELRDVKDNHVLGAAASAQAEVLVTGDKYLLVLKNFGEILIMSPADFLQSYFPE